MKQKPTGQCIVLCSCLQTIVLAGKVTALSSCILTSYPVPLITQDYSLSLTYKTPKNTIMFCPHKIYTSWTQGDVNKAKYTLVPHAIVSQFNH